MLLFLLHLAHSLLARVFSSPPVCLLATRVAAKPRICSMLADPAMTADNRIAAIYRLAADPTTACALIKLHKFDYWTAHFEILL